MRLVLVCSASVLLMAMILDRAGWLSAPLMFGDTRAAAIMPLSAGSLSDAGILIWWSAAVVSLFAALVCRRRAGLSFTTGPDVRYHVATGVLTAVLALDDLFLLHERVWPKLFLVEQNLVYALYVTVILFWLLTYRRRLLAYLPGWLLVALGCFGASVLIDAFPFSWPVSDELSAVLEDGFKWIGISLWSARLWGESLAAVALRR